MFTYLQLLEDIEFLKFLGLKGGIIGKSEVGYDIPYIHYGSKKGKQIIITGGIHARENVSASLVIRQAFYLAKKAEVIEGGIYFVPMINVDGALLIEKGADFFGDRRDFLIKTNGGSEDFRLWKANINAVDLNTNFDANFGTGKSNISYPAPENYTGKNPFDQSETRSLMEFTRLVNPSSTVSYHALGQELYWYFGQTKNLDRDNEIATKLNSILGYKKIDDDQSSAGGYKDYCIQKLNIPAFTIEIGNNALTHPLTDDDITEDFLKNKDLPAQLLSLV